MYIQHLGEPFMKTAIIGLSLLTFVACGKKGAKDQAPTVPSTIIDAQVDPNKPNSNGRSDGSTAATESTGTTGIDGPGTTGTGTGTGTDGSNPGATGPVVGLYLGACEVEGALGISSGIEITSTHIFPATALFSATDCARDSLIAWGHTGDYANFASFAAYTAEKSKADGDEKVASFDNGTIKLVSKAGITTSLIKTKATLAPEKRLKIFVSKHTVDIKTGLVSGELTLTQGPLVKGEFDIGFYCEDANKKIVRQESSFSVSAGGVVSFVGKLNTWAPVPVITRCQVTLAALQKSSGTTHSNDVAWSQFIEVK